MDTIRAQLGDAAAAAAARYLCCGGHAEAAAPTVATAPCEAAPLRRELQALSLRKLQQRAEAAGAAEETLDALSELERVEQAAQLVALIVEAEAPPPSQRAEEGPSGLSPAPKPPTRDAASMTKERWRSDAADQAMPLLERKRVPAPRPGPAAVGHAAATEKENAGRGAKREQELEAVHLAKQLRKARPFAVQPVHLPLLTP